MFLLMLLGRILCLQKREDFEFFVGFLLVLLLFCFFFWEQEGSFQALFMLKEFLLSSASGPQMWKDPSTICLLAINALCSEGSSSCGCLAHSSFPLRTRWQVWTESCCLSTVLQWNVLYQVLLCSPEPAERCLKSRTLAGSFAITQHVCWVNKVTAFSPLNFCADLWVERSPPWRALHHSLHLGKVKPCL